MIDLIDIEKIRSNDQRHLLHPASASRDNKLHGPTKVFVKGEGIYVYDENDNKYIDGLSQLWNVNIGHGRKEIAEEAKAQMEQLAFAHSFNRFSNIYASKLAAKIASLTPGDLNVVHFTSGGSESNDTAFKLVRHYFQLQGKTKKQKIISRRRGYHGVTTGATNATGLPVFREKIGAMDDSFQQAMAPYCFRCELSKVFPSCGFACVQEDIRGLIERENPEEVAAIIVEPIQGAGGVIIPPDGYLKELRQLCDEYDILLIADEVITGFGRTGNWFGVDHEGIVPDLLTFAKGVTSGYIPLGGVVIRDEVHEVISKAGSGVLPHGFTYSGHPTASRIALKNIEIMEKEKLVENAKIMGEYFISKLTQLKEKYNVVGKIDGRGLIAQIEIVEDSATNKPFPRDKKSAETLFATLLDKGLITRSITHYDTDIIAFCPPLIITKEEIDVMIQILEESIEEIWGEQ